MVDGSNGWVGLVPLTPRVRQAGVQREPCVPCLTRPPPPFHPTPDTNNG